MQVELANNTRGVISNKTSGVLSYDVNQDGRTILRVADVQWKSDIHRRFEEEINMLRHQMKIMEDNVASFVMQSNNTNHFTYEEVSCRLSNKDAPQNMNTKRELNEQLDTPLKETKSSQVVKDKLVQKFKTEIKELLAENKKLTTDKSKLASANEVLQSENRESNLSVQNMKKEQNGLTSEITRLSEQLLEQKSMNEQLVLKMQTLEIAYEDLKIKCKNYNTEKETLQKQINNLKAKLETASNSKKKLRNDNRSLRSLNIKCEAENQALKTKNELLTSREKELTAKESKLISENEELATKESKLISENEAQTTRIHSMELEIGKMNGTIHSMKLDNARMNRSNKHMIQQIRREALFIYDTPIPRKWYFTKYNMMNILSRYSSNNNNG